SPSRSKARFSLIGLQTGTTLGTTERRRHRKSLQDRTYGVGSLGSQPRDRGSSRRGRAWRKSPEEGPFSLPDRALRHAIALPSILVIRARKCPETSPRWWRRAARAGDRCRPEVRPRIQTSA